MQHWNIVLAHKLDYFQGQITKYVMRWKHKGGIQDLEKAQHFLSKYLAAARAGQVEGYVTPEPTKGYVDQ
jgi:hypothetical protein